MRMHFDQILEEHLKYGKSDEVAECEDTYQMAEKIQEITMKKLEGTAFYGRERLRFLVNSEEDRHWYLLLDLHTKRELVHHLMEIENQATEFIEMEKPKMMESWGITEKLKEEDQMKWVGLMNNLNMTLRRMALEEIVYI